MTSKRPYNSTTPLALTTFVPGASAQVELEMNEYVNPQFLVEATFGTIVNGDGLDMTIFPGFWDGIAKKVIYADNGNVIPNISQPSVNGQVCRTAFSLNSEIYPEYVNLVIGVRTANSIKLRVLGVG